MAIEALIIKKIALSQTYSAPTFPLFFDSNRATSVPLITLTIFSYMSEIFRIFAT